MLSRPLSPYEKWFASTIQYSVELRTPRLATEFADYLIKSIASFRLRSDGETLSLAKEPVEVWPIARGLNTSRDVCLWGDRGLRELRKDRLAAVAIRDNHLVISLSHVCFDGVSWILVMERFARGEFSPQIQFPIPIDHQLRDVLAGPLNPDEHVQARLRLSSLKWSSPRVKTWEDDEHCDFLYGEYRPSEIKCFNPKTNKFVGLTDALWRAGILTAHAINPAQSSYGCFTWVNLRPFVNDKGLGCLAGPCSIIADGVSPNMTVGEFEKLLRRDFSAKIKRKYYFDGMKAMVDDIPVPRPPSAFFDVSNVGYFPTSGPFVDAWGQMTPLARSFTDNIGLSSVTNFGKDEKLTLRYPYSQLVFTRSDAAKAFKGIVHSMKNIGPEVKLADALKELREVAV